LLIIFPTAPTRHRLDGRHYDGIIAAWDGKYHYWGIRPFQYDPDFEPILVDTPNFPGYPAGHTTVAGSLATAFLFSSRRTKPSSGSWPLSVPNPVSRGAFISEPTTR
jgi:membrane-associated phospholipid phosphatase